MTLAQCFRALRARGFSVVRSPGIDGAPDDEFPLEEVLTLPDDGEEYEVIGHEVWMLPITEFSEPYWVAVPSPPPAWVPSVWDRLMVEEAP